MAALPTPGIERDSTTPSAAVDGTNTVYELVLPSAGTQAAVRASASAQAVDAERRLARLERAVFGSDVIPSLFISYYVILLRILGTTLGE